MNDELTALLEQTEVMLNTLYGISFKTANPLLDTLCNLRGVLEETKELLTGQFAVIEKQKLEKWIGKA